MRGLRWLRHAGLSAALLSVGALFIVGAGQAAGAPVLVFSPASGPYGTIAPGTSSSKTFVLSNSGGTATAALSISLSGSATFSKTSDGCSGTSLGPKKSCSIQISYAATTQGTDDTGQLTAKSKKPLVTASVTLTGHADTAPTANAGPDQTVDEGALVSLDGSGSSDPENDTLTYNWSQTAGTTVSLTDANTASPTFTAPSGPATLTFQLQVCDPFSLCSTDSVTVTVNVNPPGLSLSKLVDGQSSVVANLGDQVTFTLTVGEGGPSAASSLAVNDLLPAGLSFVGATPSVGSYDPNTGVWTVGSLQVGASATLSIVATVTTIGGSVPTSITNTATASDDQDPTVSASATVNVNPPSP